MTQVEMKEIPGSLGFVASSDGRIFDKNGNERPYYVTNAGYLCTGIAVENHAKIKKFDVHRLVALAFHPEVDTDNKNVNHRDFNRLNNAASNLEWVTSKQNSLHAALFRENAGNPIAYVITPEGSYEFAYDIRVLSNRIGCEPLEIWDAVKENKKINGYEVVPMDARTRIPKQLQKPRTGVIPKSGPVKVLDVETNETTVYESRSAMARHFGCTLAAVCLTMSTSDRLRLFRNRYVVVDSEDNFPPLNLDYIAKARRRNGFQVLVYDVANDKFLIYASSKQFMMDKGLTRNRVNVRLWKNRIEEVDGYYFVWYTPEQKERLLSVIGRPGPTL